VFLAEEAYAYANADGAAANADGTAADADSHLGTADADGAAADADSHLGTADADLDANAHADAHGVHASSGRVQPEQRGMGPVRAGPPRAQGKRRVRRLHEAAPGGDERPYALSG
jgi:hypothetical protein